MIFNLYEKGDVDIHSKSAKGLIVAGLTGGVAIAISILSYPFISPALRRVCLPYVPATNKQISNVLHALEGRHGTLLDIGSGDGRIVFAAAKQGFKASGVELNPWLVFYSRFKALRYGLRSCATFHRCDLWKMNFKSFDNLVIFGVNEMMDDLHIKFEKELEDTYVVACRFPIPNRTPLKVIGSGIDTVWLYRYYKVVK